MATSVMESPPRPQANHASKSFSRLDSPRSSPQSSPLSRSRASTLQNGVPPRTIISEMMTSPLEEKGDLQQDDIFEKDNLVSESQGTIQDVSEMDFRDEGFDELPIELISLIDR